MSVEKIVKWAAVTFLVAAVVIIYVRFILTAASVGDREQYVLGYCAALGGEALNNDTCNVDGRVVVIPRTD